jgi:hypothetical protein
MGETGTGRKARILFLAARAELPPHKLGLLKELLAGPFDGGRLTDQAYEQEVHPLLNHTLGRVGFDPPAPWRQRLRDACHKSLARNLLLDSELARVLATLTREGVPALSLKGPQLARTVYGSIDLRTSGDLDIWIRARDAKRAADALQGSGYGICLPLTSRQIPRYVSFDKSLDLVKEDDPVPFFVDLHWDVASPEQMIRADIDSVWERAMEGGRPGNGPASLALEDLLLFLTLHGYGHGWDRLKLLCDIDQFVCRFGDLLDWPAVARRARGWGMSDILERGLRLSALLLETPLPTESAVCLEGRYWLSDPLAEPGRFLTASLEERKERSTAGGWLSRLHGRRGASHRVRQVLGSFHPKSMDFLAMPRAGRHPWLFWLLRPIRVTGKLAAERGPGARGREPARRTLRGPSERQRSRTAGPSRSG